MSHTDKSSRPWLIDLLRVVVAAAAALTLLTLPATTDQASAHNPTDA